MPETVTAFLDGRIIAAGERGTVTRAIEERYPATDHAAIHIFDDGTGKVTDLDLWDAGASVPARLSRGRPKLGVQAREVTLLPRHWDWLGKQPGGASAALRRLVEEARRAGGSSRERQDAAYHFMQAMCGDRPGYEEALRALYRGDRPVLDAIVKRWPEDVRTYLGRLLDG
jgi:hypothetical protein